MPCNKKTTEETTKTKESAKKPAPVKYTVKYDKEKKDWVIAKTGVDRAIRRLKTKEEALKVAKELSENQDISLVVHKKDGKFQKQ